MRHKTIALQDMKRHWSIESLPPKTKVCCSARLVVALAGFTAVYNLNHIRIYVSFAMVCMVHANNKNRTEKPDCPDVKTADNPSLYEFEWSPELKGHLISGAFYGLLIGPFIGGLLSFKYGGKKILIIGTIMAGVTHVFLPEAARFHPQLFFVIRIFSGFFAGFILPSYYDILGHWVVPEEKQLLVGGSLAGIPFSSLTNTPVQGFLCNYLGWTSPFYASSVWLILCGVAYIFWIYDSPNDCPFIKEQEKKYLYSRMSIQDEIRPIPWRKIFTSMPILTYSITHFGVNYGFIAIHLSLPMFMNKVHRMDLQSNGLLSGLPFVGSFTCRIILSIFFEKIREKSKVSKMCLRKIFILVGFILILSSLLAIILLTCKFRYLVLAFFVVCVIGIELTLASGYLLCLMDLCPNYTNILTGITNAISNLAGLIGPVVTGFLTTKEDNWYLVYISCMGVFAFSYIYFLIFGKSDRLEWDRLQIIPRSFHRESAIY